MHTVSYFFSAVVLYWGRELTNLIDFDLVITLIFNWNSLLSMDFCKMYLLKYLKRAQLNKKPVGIRFQNTKFEDTQ